MQDLPWRSSTYGELPDPRAAAEALEKGRSNLHLTALWLAIGDLEQAKRHALATYKKAWADGEPFVLRFELTKATNLLQKIGVEIPSLPPYDPAKEEKQPWEDAVGAAIEKLRATKQSRGSAPQ